ncbi:MAG: type IV secretory system conjugative DNA transfer family protein [Clostridiales bacterium]|nr:type IV secretory system conjugative DNA transfer family protein [Clostridiales bacterium]
MRKEALKHKKKKSRSLAVLLWFIIFAFVQVLIAYVYALSGANNITEILGKRNFWLLGGVVDGLIIIAYLMMYRIDAQNIALNENDLEDTEWLTTKKLKKMNEFTVSTWNDVEDHEDGIVIGAEKKGKDVEIITTKQLHALIVGTTGSGKTTGFVDQNISVLSKSQGKPSIVISDPKKELYEKHANQLLKEGYKISVLDLREPYSSARWNPMHVLIRRIRLVKELEKVESKDGKYFGTGEVFLSHRDLRARIQELKDEIFENAMDLVYTLCPVENHEQPNWEMGARNLIFGFVLALCEDCIKGVIEEKQLLLFNVYHNITKYCSEDTTALKAYLMEGRDEFSKVRGLVNTVLITSDKTLTSYLSEVNSYMQQLADDGILSLTSENDLDIVNMDESANAVFIIIPDERFTRHRFVTLFITQMYKELVEKANLNLRRHQTETAVLKRNTYFVLDEFGNLPKFENMEGMVTVARSRGIRFLFVLQSFSQLNVKYGRDVGDVIKTNCNVKIFIGTDDGDTRKEFSELCGQKKIKNFSVNTSIEHSASSSTGATNQPLITVGMLERLNGDEKGDAIVSVRGYEPIWTKFTPSYKLAHIYFPEGKADLSKREAVLFEKADYVFDIYKEQLESEEEKIRDKGLDDLEEMEQEDERKEQERATHIRELRAKWESIVNDIEQKLRKLVIYLDGRDSRVVLAAKLENKATLLYTLMDNYSQSTAERMMGMADYISSRLLLLDKIQKEADQEKGG